MASNDYGQIHVIFLETHFGSKSRKGHSFSHTTAVKNVIYTERKVGL